MATSYEVTSLADPGDGTCDLAGTGDGCTLREAINAANGNAGADTITFAAGVVGPINLTNGSLRVSDGVEVRGPGADELTIKGVLDEGLVVVGGLTRPERTVTFSGLTLTDGFAATDFGGAILSLTDECAADLVLDAVAVVDNKAGGNGGGVAVESGRDLCPAGKSAGKVTGSTTTGPLPTSTPTSTTVPPPPGGSLIVRNSTIAGNEAPSGGGIFYEPNSPDANLEIVNSTIADNTAGSRGGGLVLCCAGDDHHQHDDRRQRSWPGRRRHPCGRLDHPELHDRFGQHSRGERHHEGHDCVGSGDGPFEAGHSLIGTTDGATVTENPAGTNLIGVDPQLGALGNNGGPTRRCCRRQAARRSTPGRRTR